MKNRQKLIGNLMLILAAFIWGIAFSAQTAGMDYLGPFSFNGIRFIIGGIVLIPVIFLMKKHSSVNIVHDRAYIRKLIKAGVLCGILLGAASCVQQVGLIYTTAGKAGFITALYVIMVPLFGLVIGKRPAPILCISVAIAVAGMYFLCVAGSLSLNTGDILVFICAILYTFHIIVVDKLAPGLNGVELSCIQFFIAGIISLIIVPINHEVITIEAVRGCLIPLLYAGVLSSGVAYTFQILGQQRTSPVLASLLLSLESVFAAVMAWFILGQPMSSKEIFGASLCFAAIILAQLPIGQKKLCCGKEN